MGLRTGPTDKVPKSALNLTFLSFQKLSLILKSRSHTSARVYLLTISSSLKLFLRHVSTFFLGCVISIGLLRLWQLGFLNILAFVLFIHYFQLFSRRSQGSSARYRAAKASVKPSSRYGKLGFRVWVVSDLFWVVFDLFFSLLDVCMDKIVVLWCVGYLVWFVGSEIKLMQVKQWRDLLISPKRASIA